MRKPKVLAIVGIVAVLGVVAYAAFTPVVAEAQVISPLLRNVWVIIQTSARDDAGTDDDFAIEIQKSDSTWLVLNPDDLPWDENEDGRTETYTWNVSNQNVRAIDFSGRICIIMDGSDGWLLRSIWILGDTANDEELLLASQPNWPSNAWLSTDSGEGAQIRSLSGSPRSPSCT